MSARAASSFSSASANCLLWSRMNAAARSPVGAPSELCESSAPGAVVLHAATFQNLWGCPRHDRADHRGPGRAR